MAARPNALHPERSLEEWLGNEIRQWRMLRGYGQDQLGALVHLSGDLIGKMERGERTCLPEHAEALDVALDTGGALTRSLVLVQMRLDKRRDGDSFAAEVAQNPQLPPPVSTLEPMERRAFVAAGGLVAEALTPITASVVLPLLEAGAPVRPGDVAHVQSAAVALRGSDNLYGGGGLVQATAIAQLHWARSLTSAPCDEALRAELLTTASRLASATGAVLLDAGEHDDSRRCLHWATELAEEVGDWSARAVSYNLRSRLASWCERHDDGVTLAEMGLVRSDRLSPAERAMLHNAAARAHAKMGNRQAALTAIGMSDEEYTRLRTDQEVSWMAYYDSAQHHGDTGHAAYDLALAGYQVDDAITRLRAAVDGHAQSFARSRTFSRTKLACLLLAIGNPETALPEAERAVAEVAQLRSQRAVQDLHDLAVLASRYGRNAGLQGLRAQIAATVDG
ncbi:helix-turn-helix domain-containing protein [Kitasatospora sp. NPDC059817]|uniref:helix-turn-helix domain-containing protein n=1 Tax=Kitasatospora sp. NPDC059817 TaxID=3346961 RepID=UPI00365D5050